MALPRSAGKTDLEDCWESSLLPPRRALLRKVPSNGPSRPASAGVIAAAPTPARAVTEHNGRGQLLSIEMRNFKCFAEKTVAFNGDGLSCVVGPNSSGKSSILDAINFVTLQHVKCIRGLVRRCRPAILTCCVTAVFETQKSGKLTLRREVTLDSPTEHKVTHAAALGSSPMKDISEPEYASWIGKMLCWRTDDVMVNQFGLIEENSVKHLLARLSHAMDKLEAEGDVRRPMLKRRCIHGESSVGESRVTGIRTTAEAWVGRRLDELYRELSREPLDAEFETWGDGGQACLRRLPDGSFTIIVSQQRGLAASGFGSPLESMSDGDRDLCALALLLTLPGLTSGTSGLQDVLPPLVILDEPDSRLDKRGACCMRRLLSGPGRPEQSLVMSLNNHRAFTDLQGTVELHELESLPSVSGDHADEEGDPYGDSIPRRRSRRC